MPIVPAVGTQVRYSVRGVSATKAGNNTELFFTVPAGLEIVWAEFRVNGGAVQILVDGNTIVPQILSIKLGDGQHTGIIPLKAYSSLYFINEITGQTPNLRATLGLRKK